MVILCSLVFVLGGEGPSTWTEIIQPRPTHFDFSGQSCSRIDRIWAFGLSSLSIKMYVRSHVVSSPVEYYGQGLSDHTPLIASLGRHARIDSSSNYCRLIADVLHAATTSCWFSYCSSNSMPRFVCNHPECKLQLNSIAWYCDLLEMSARKQLAVYEMCFEEASKKVLLHIQPNEED